MDGAVLAGGEGKRMSALGGGPKPFVELGGRPLISWVLEALRPMCQEVFIVADRVEPYTALGCRVMKDLIPGKGPMGGVYTALASTGEREVFVAACDSPFLNPQVVRYLASQVEGFEVVVPRLSDGFHPLQAVYTRDCLPRLHDCLMSDRLSLTEFFHGLTVRVVPEWEIRPLDPGGLSFLNVNTPQDLALAAAWITGVKVSGL